MTQPTCYVIAHPQSRVINDCVASLKKHNWTFEVSPAVDGNKVTADDWQRIGIRMSDQGKMPRRPGAQGCWHSHYKLWNWSITVDKPIVIMEHDAVVNHKWPEQLNIADKLVKLFSSAECKVNPAFGRWSKGAHAYTVTPKQAKILIEYAKINGAQAVDKHLGDAVLPWTFLDYDLVSLNPKRGPSSTSPMRRI